MSKITKFKKTEVFNLILSPKKVFDQKRPLELLQIPSLSQLKVKK